MGTKDSLFKNGVVKLNIHRQKNEVRVSPYKVKKNQFKMHQRAKTVRYLEENTGERHHDIGLGDYFLDVTPKTIKEK
jgi:hypothetical protein